MITNLTELELLQDLILKESVLNVASMSEIEIWIYFWGSSLILFAILKLVVEAYYKK